MPLMIHATDEYPLDDLEDCLRTFPGVTVSRGKDVLSLEIPSWHVRDELQTLLASIGIPAENMKTVDPPTTPSVVGRPMRILDVDAA